MCATDVTTHMKTKKKRARFYSIKVLRNSHFLIICLAWFHIVRWTKHTKFSCPDWPQCNDFEWNHRKKYIIGQKKMIEFSLPKIDLLAPVLRHWRDVQYIVLCIQLIRVKLFACTQGIGEEQQKKLIFLHLISADCHSETHSIRSVQTPVNGMSTSPTADNLMLSVGNGCCWLWH